jgi:hypothetical protein
MSSEAQTAKMNMENILNELSTMLFHEQTLKKLCDDQKKIFESNIVRPMVTSNLRAIKKDDLDIDVVPIGNADEKVLQARYKWFNYTMELAELRIDIEAKKQLYKKYQEHVKAYYNKQQVSVTDDMIYAKLTTAQALEKLSPDEIVTLDKIVLSLPQRITGNHSQRIDLYESIENFILQHGS